MKHILLSLLVIISLSQAVAQKTILFCKDKQTGMPLSGVQVMQGGQTLTSTNKAGIASVEMSTSKFVQSSIYLSHVDNLLLPASQLDSQRGDTLFYSLFSSLSGELDEIRIEEKRPGETFFPHVRLSKKQIQTENVSRDMPYILQQTPGLLAQSDAGAGIGYTALRIRGSDQTRINITVNGVPVNDAETHQVFWVNMPDLASSTTGITVQRGVGSSTNGAAAFGANVHLNTLQQNTDKEMIEVGIQKGMFGTQSFRAQYQTQEYNGWSASGRLSLIQSDGYIDRATSELASRYLSLKKKWSPTSSMEFIHFGGDERTYQSWFGTPESRVDGDVQAMKAYADRNFLSFEERRNLLESGRTYNYYTYADQVDDYSQDHYQYHLKKRTAVWDLHSALFYTRGKGFFEEFKAGETLSDYAVVSDVPEGDVVRRRWLDNHLIGIIGSAKRKIQQSTLTLGGGAQSYIGDHFGEVVDVNTLGTFWNRGQEEYYSNESLKQEAHAYVKWESQWDGNIQLYADAQVRGLRHSGEGRDNDGVAIDFEQEFTFFNPKAGIQWQMSPIWRSSLSGAIANREPIRSDFIDNQFGETPTPERLLDLEYILQGKLYNWNLEAVLFAMEYENQLVLTGALNDVGAGIRTNVDQSFRRGIELQASRSWKKWNVSLNSHFSRNRILGFQENIENYVGNTVERITRNYDVTDIALSPSFVGQFRVEYSLTPASTVGLYLSTVGKQYLDNTSSEEKTIDAYQTLDIQWSTNWKYKQGTGRVFLRCNNVLNTLYSSHGYTYSYGLSGEIVSENFYYPQAGFHLTTGVEISL